MGKNIFPSPRVICMKHMADQSLAISCYTSSCRLRRGSAIGRPSYIPGQTVAAVLPDSQIYGSVFATVVFVDAEESWA